MTLLQRLPTIRAKLGSVIVFAVVLTVALVYFLLALALGTSLRNADLVELLQLAQDQSRSATTVHDGTTSFLSVEAGKETWLGPPLADPPRFEGGVHVGVAGGVEYAAVPLRSTGGGMLYAVREVPGAWVSSARFLLEFWWQLLLAGAAAAARERRRIIGSSWRRPASRNGSRLLGRRFRRPAGTTSITRRGSARNHARGPVLRLTAASGRFNTRAVSPESPPCVSPARSCPSSRRRRRRPRSSPTG